MNDFIIHLDDYGKSLKGMSNEEVGELIKALIAHIEGEEVEISSPTVNAVFPIMSGRMDRDLAYRKKASEYGKKGGAPIGNTNAKNKGNTRVIQGSDKGKQTPNPNPKPNPNINKKPYGEFENVFLTDDEYQKIKDKGLDGLIEELSSYISSKGVKYKSHYATIISWENRRKNEKHEEDSVVIKKTPFNTGYSKRERESNEVLEQKFIKNL